MDTLFGLIGLGVAHALAGHGGGLFGQAGGESATPGLGARTGLDYFSERDHEAPMYAFSQDASMHDYARSTMRQPHEVVAAFGPDGKQLFKPKVGGHGSVKLSQAEGDLVRSNGNVTMVHNHPNGSPPSRADFTSSAYWNLARHHISCPDGLVYSRYRPEAGWPSEKQLMDAYSAASAEVVAKAGKNLGKREDREAIFRSLKKHFGPLGVNIDKAHVSRLWSPE